MQVTFQSAAVMKFQQNTLLDSHHKQVDQAGVQSEICGRRACSPGWVGVARGNLGIREMSVLRGAQSMGNVLCVMNGGGVLT